LFLAIFESLLIVVPRRRKRGGEEGLEEEETEKEEDGDKKEDRRGRMIKRKTRVRSHNLTFGRWLIAALLRGWSGRLSTRWGLFSAVSRRRWRSPTLRGLLIFILWWRGWTSLPILICRRLFSGVFWRMISISWSWRRRTSLSALTPRRWRSLFWWSSLWRWSWWWNAWWRMSCVVVRMGWRWTSCYVIISWWGWWMVCESIVWMRISSKWRWCRLAVLGCSWWRLWRSVFISANIWRFPTWARG
jgi:hypothetical protein